MDYKQFFEQWGNSIASKNTLLDQGGNCFRMETLTVEDLYQAFKARMIAEQPKLTPEQNTLLIAAIGPSGTHPPTPPKDV